MGRYHAPQNVLVSDNSYAHDEHRDNLGQ